MSPLCSGMAITWVARAAAAEGGAVPARQADAAKAPANDYRPEQTRRPAPRTPIRHYPSSFAL